MNRWLQDWRSKIIDGVLPAVVLLIMLLFLNILVPPVQMLGGQPGLLLYALVLLAAAAVFLERSTMPDDTGLRRAAWGMAAGLFLWNVIRLSNEMSPLFSTNAGNLILMALLVVFATLWRRVFPLGVRFFAVALLANWCSAALVYQMQLAAQQSLFFSLIEQFSKNLAGAASLMVLVWIFGYSQNRIQRLWAALWLWVILSHALYH